MTMCAGKTTQGRRCTRQVTGRSKYCWQHQGNKRSVKRRTSTKKLTGAEREHQKRYCRCVMHVKEQGGDYNPWAVCTKSVGRVTNSCKEFE